MTVEYYDTRPSAVDIRTQWHDLFRDPLLGPDTFKRQALQAPLKSGCNALLRSIYWRIFYGVLPFPNAVDSPAWSIAIEAGRSEWQQLSQRFLTSPDGRPIDSAMLKGKIALQGTSSASGVSAGSPDITQNNPLSVDANNPWTIWFQDLEMRQEIRKDVLRTFPDYPYFQQENVQLMMTNILHVWTKLNGDIGYRQGMHELLAPILWMTDYDSLEQQSPLEYKDPKESCMYATLSREYIEHDAFAVFTKLMHHAKTFYDSSPSIPVSSKGNTPDLATRARFPDPSTQKFKVVQPIINVSNRIQETRLARVKPELAEKLAELDIEPQLWAMRWLRLLFSREFPMQETLALWDAIFADDATLQIVEWICVAMLLRASTEILQGEYSDALQVLLKYPKPPDGKWQIFLLYQQAIKLREDPSPITASLICQQNVAFGISIQNSPTLPSNAVLSGGRVNGVHVLAQPRGERAKLPANRILEGRDYVEDIAKGVYERAEALGINKALIGAFGEVRKYGQQALQPPGVPAAQMMQQNSSDGFPNGATSLAFRSAAEQSQLGRENARLRENNRACANALEFCMKQMRLPDTSSPATQISSLLPVFEHIQDILNGKANTFDPTILVNAQQPISTSLSSTQSTSLDSVEPTAVSSSQTAREDRIIDRSTRLPIYLSSGFNDQPITSLPRIAVPVNNVSAYGRNQAPHRRQSPTAPPRSSNATDQASLTVPALSSQYKNYHARSALDPLGVQ